MPAPSSPSPTVPRWKEIRDDLEAMLPKFRYGERFCSIAEICQKYDVSTITARRALAELQGSGLVEKIRSRGTVVRQLPRAVNVRLVLPVGLRPDYRTHSVILRRMLTGITAFAEQNQVDFDTFSEEHLQLLFAKRGETFGFLVLPGLAMSNLDLLHGRRSPHVFLNPLKAWKGQPHARSDKLAAGYLGTRHLLELGHRRIAYVIGAISQRHFRDRLNGYRRALKEAGVPFRWSLVHESDGEHAEQDHQAVEALLSRKSPPTAIIAADDNRAIHILEALHRRGVKVPQQVSVLGYPNYPESKLTQPALSVVDAAYEEVGTAAMRLLMAQMHEGADPASQAIAVAPRLVQRESVAPPAPRINPSDR